MALIENTLFGDRDKVNIAIERLRQFETPEGYWVADSGGKDSEVIVDLVLRSGVKAEYHHNLTTVDAPETIHHIRKYHPQTVIDRPDIPLVDFMISTPSYGLPSQKCRWCCAKYKERGGKGRFVVTGTRSLESANRSGRRMIDTCTKDTTKRYLNVIVDWSDVDVWEYISKRNLNVNPVYSMGYSRCGCVLCPMARWEDRMKHIADWPKLVDRWRNGAKSVHKYKADRMLSGGQLSFDLFWSKWIHWNAPGKQPPPDDNQITMFGEYEDSRAG